MMRDGTPSARANWSVCDGASAPVTPPRKLDVPRLGSAQIQGSSRRTGHQAQGQPADAGWRSTPFFQLGCVTGATFGKTPIIPSVRQANGQEQPSGLCRSTGEVQETAIPLMVENTIHASTGDEYR